MSAEKAINFDSGEKQLSFSKRMIENINVIGLKCEWSAEMSPYCTSILVSWKFDWTDIGDHKVDGLKGSIYIGVSNISNEVMEVEFSDNNTAFEKTIKNERRIHVCPISMQFSLVPLKIWVQQRDEMFAPSIKNDATLYVEGNQICVNKQFLEFHSKYFMDLFNHQSKTDGLPEVSDVSFADFGLLIGCIHPNTKFPNDKTVAILAELGHRFKMESVLRHVEHHLLHVSKLSEEAKLSLADKYSLSGVLEASINALDMEKVKKLKSSVEYIRFSDHTKGLILDKFLEII